MLSGWMVTLEFGKIQESEIKNCTKQNSINIKCIYYLKDQVVLMVLNDTEGVGIACGEQ